MRSEEEFTKDSIEKYLIGTGIIPTILPGREPPDYFVTIDSKTYPLEVTNAETLAYQDDGKPGKLRHYSSPFIDFYREINTSPIVDKTDVPADKTVLIFVKLPISDWNDFRNVFKILLNEGYLVLVSEIIEKFPENITHSSVVDKANNGIPIKFAIGAKNPEIDIALQVRKLLVEIVETKERKLNKAGITGERWLGILNNYFFDDKGIWSTEVSNLAIDHSFKRIFIVSSHKEVIDVGFN